MTFILAATLLASHPRQQPSAEPNVLAAGAGAAFKRVDNMHRVRFIEIFLARREAKTGNMVAARYNTMFTSKSIPASKGTAPQALVAGLDFDRMKKEYGVVGASLNGPKLWLPDWSEIEAGVQGDFNGLTAAWVAQLDMRKYTSVGEGTPDKPVTIARRSRLGWNKGTTVILLWSARKRESFRYASIRSRSSAGSPPVRWRA